jgi:hypothetical protein
MANDAVNANIANAHVAVMTSQWDAKQLGQYYESIATPIATPIASWSPEITAYRNAATEY